MDPRLLEITNEAFYNKEIKNGYKSNAKNAFLCPGEAPMMFINHDEFENDFGNSKVNKEEAKIVADLLKHLT